MTAQQERIVVSPGPVHVDVSRWEQIPPTHHRSDSFRKVVYETEDMLRELLDTGYPVYLITSSGTGAMEAAVANVTMPGSSVLVVSGGKFGERWAEICGAYGCQVDMVRFPPGDAVDIEKIVSRVKQSRPEYLALTHVESSTGVLFPLRELVEALPNPRPLIMVDAISSLGAEELKMDRWGLDVVVGACQKALAAPTGLSFVSLGARAMVFMKARSMGLYYFSLNRYEQSRTKGETPFTPAVQIVQMVHRSLSGIKSLGWEAMRRRHEKSSRAFLAAAPHISLSSFPEEPSSAVLALVLPTRCRGVGIVEELAEKKGIIAADGQELLKGMMIRTGFLGLYGGKTIRRIVTSLGAVIEGHGCSVDIDSAEKAVESLSDQEDIFR